MAFLCPVRIRRGKKKKSLTGDADKDLSRPSSGLGLNHGLGRITGSASIETLVRVGIEKEHGLSPDSKMVVLHDFTPCVDDELEVRRGQIINVLYRENDWVYVIGQDTRQEGFIPHSYCAPYNTQLADLAIKKKLPRDQVLLSSSTNTGIGGVGGSLSSMQTAVQDPIEGIIATTDIAVELIDDLIAPNGGLMGLDAQLKHSQASLSSEPDFLPFAKDPSGRYIVLYTFIARDENDVSVERGEFVTVLNREDPDWFWIVRSDGQEGFIPSGFVYPADNVLQARTSLINTQHNAAAAAAATIALASVGGGGGPGGGGGVCVGNSNNNISSLNNNTISPAEITTNQGNVGGGNNNQSGSGVGNNNGAATQQSQQQQPPIIGSDDLRYHGTELVMLYDYKAQAPDDLSVRRGDWIYADLNNQTVDGWLWAYAPKTRKYGFIPKAYARPPAMTSL